MRENQRVILHSFDDSAPTLGGLEPTKKSLLKLASLVLVLVVLGWFSATTVSNAEDSLRASTASKLETILNIETEAIRQWVESHEQVAALLASELGDGINSSEIQGRSWPERPLHLEAISRRTGGARCFVTTDDGEFVSSSFEVESTSVEILTQLITRVRDSSRPVTSPVLRLAEDSWSGPECITIVVAPIRSIGAEPIGFLGLVLDVRKELSHVLESSRSGVTGETIAVDQDGFLLSAGRISDASERFRDWDMKDLNSRSTVSVSFAGKLDYRGRPVALASRWLPKLGVGVITKVDLSEVNRPISQVRSFIWTLFLLVLVATVLTLFYRWYVYKLRQAAKQAELERRNVGAYELETKIGEGGMGTVYRANHRLLRRPTAIKILPPEKSGQTSIEQFEREVRFTSQLKHHNTISIYDYGWTESGLFYYAMELLEGCNLERLVRINGRVNDGRLLFILRQVCHSLREAHSQGLVHRDIKPANIMLCDRGGACDLVKVLDFGMVRHRQDETSDGSVKVSGTPIYMAPECFSVTGNLDPRVDVFSVGAVAFYLATGESLLAAERLQDLFRYHREDIAAEAGKRLNKLTEIDFSPELKRIISACVATKPTQRVSSVTQLLDLLAGVCPSEAWGAEQATEWWATHSRKVLETQDTSEANFMDSATLGRTEPFLEWGKKTAPLVREL